MPIVPTPPLAKASTTYEPTPPKPNTKTLDLFNLYTDLMFRAKNAKKEIAAVLDIVNKNDRAAFVIVSDAREVMGEGFIESAQ